jgi:ATP-dependent DNA helicase DinG
MKALQRLSAGAVAALREAIADAGGNEVFAVGRLGDDGLVAEVTVAARGNETSVPALRPYLERGDALIHNHPSGRLVPSEPDMAVASRVGGQGIGFFIVDNRVEEVYVVAEPVVLRELRPLDPEILAGELEPGGGLDRIIPEYESRPTQVAMLRLVARAFNQSSPCMAEAGTGVGKSLAYLLPALQWAATNDERVVVSTSTINLQQQLVDKDIPLVKELLGLDVPVVLVKGRRNYVCPKRLAEAIDEDEEGLDPGEARELAAIAEWARTTASGSRSDLPFNPSEPLWSRVCSEADLCHGLSCSQREGCFVHRVRREAAAARLLVVNHHLLFSDLSARLAGVGYDSAAVLPPFHRIVLDEAHAIEESATSFFSESLNRFALARFCGRLHRRRKGRRLGLALALERLASGEGRTLASRIPEAVQEALDRAEILDRMAQPLLAAESALLVRDLPVDGLEEALWAPLREMETAVLTLASLVERVVEAVDAPEPDDFTIAEARLIARRLREAVRVAGRLAEYREEPDLIAWLELARSGRGERFVRFVLTPLEIAPLMREALLEPYDTIVFTSATLAVGGDFGYWQTRVGLDPQALRGIFASPFPYKERVMLGIPTDLPAPGEEGFETALGETVGDALEVSGGSGLVLFTSYATMDQVYQAVAPRLAARGIAAMRQGQDDRSRLLARFQEDVSSVLFATDSFWQGVDAPGDALRLVLICRLPFRVPSDPVMKARTEALEKRGGNSFAQLALPDAVVRLRQGFGRLMRRATDGGAVLILDTRIVKKFYGRAFLESLPPASTRVGTRSEVLSSMRSFLARL